MSQSILMLDVVKFWRENPTLIRMREAGARLGPWTPWLPMIGGVIALAYLMTIPIPHIHFSGDGAIKEYVLQTWLRGDFPSMHPSWPGNPDWAVEIYKTHPPLQQPFAVNGTVIFPPFFPLASFPFYAAFGYWGLYALPLASAVGLWATFWWLLRGRGMGGFPALVGLTTLVASPATYYGATFWEHVPALFCFLLAYALLTRAGGAKGAGAAGILAVAAVALRPEIGLPSLAMPLMLMDKASRRRLAAFAGCGVAALLVCLAVNRVSCGAWLGIHHEQVRLLYSGSPEEQRVRYWQDAWYEYPRQCLGVTWAVGLGAASWPFVKRARRERGILLLMIALTIELAPYIVPNIGGLQIFRRYELVVIPLAALLAAEIAREWAPLGCLILLLVVRTDREARLANLYEYRRSYGERIGAVWKALEARPPSILIGNNTRAFCEYAWRLPTTPMLAFDGTWRPDRALREASRHADLTTCGLALLYTSTPKFIEIHLDDRIYTATMTAKGESGYYYTLREGPSATPPGTPGAGGELWRIP